MTPTEKRNRLRAILRGNVCKSPATVWDALSARVAEAAGFECGILSGSVCAATMLGAPDLALQTLTEFADQIRRIARASDLSVFADADQGYGNALNAMRAVEELEHAGLAGLAIEDLVMPAHFGRRAEPELISVQEAVGKLKAALSARQDASLVIAARTAALRVEPIADVVERARAYTATGVDALLFVTGLEKVEDLDAFARPSTFRSFSAAHRASRARKSKRAACVSRLQGHAVLAICAKAMYDTYMHFKADGDPEQLRSGTATAEEMARLMKAVDYQTWNDAYLS